MGRTSTVDSSPFPLRFRLASDFRKCQPRRTAPDLFRALRLFIDDSDGEGAFRTEDPVSSALVFTPPLQRALTKALPRMIQACPAYFEERRQSIPFPKGSEPLEVQDGGPRDGGPSLRMMLPGGAVLESVPQSLALMGDQDLATHTLTLPIRWELQVAWFGEVSLVVTPGVDSVWREDQLLPVLPVLCADAGVPHSCVVAQLPDSLEEVLPAALIARLRIPLPFPFYIGFRPEVVEARAMISL